MQTDPLPGGGGEGVPLPGGGGEGVQCLEEEGVHCLEEEGGPLPGGGGRESLKTATLSN